MSWIFQFISVAIFVFTLSGDKHIKSKPILGIIKSTWWAMGSREFQGDVRQQGGSLIVGPGNKKFI